LEEILRQLESVRRSTRDAFNKLYYGIVQKHPRFKSELREVLGDRDLSDQDSKLMQLERKMEAFHRELSILLDRFDRLAGDDRIWVGQLIFQSQGAAVYGAATQMQGWINDCNQRIDQLRELLR